LLRALDEYFVGGIRTNLGLFRRILGDKKFIAGELSTGFLDRMLAEPSAPAGAEDEKLRSVAAIAAAIFQNVGNGAGSGMEIRRRESCKPRIGRSWRAKEALRGKK